MTIALSSRFLTLLVVLAIALGGAALHAQGTESLLSPKDLETRINALESSTDSEGAAERARAIANYKEALRLTRERESSLAKAAEFQRQTQNLSTESDPPLRGDGELQPDELPPSPDEPGDLSSSIAKFEKVKASVAAARALVEAQASEDIARAERLILLPGHISKVVADLAALPEPVAPLASTPEVERSAYHRLLARRALLKQEHESLQTELQFLEASAGAFTTGLAQQKLRFTALTRSAQAWQKLIDARRLAATDTAVEEARAEAKRFAEVPRANKVAAETALLAEQHASLSRRMADAGLRLTRIEALNTKVSGQHASALRRVRLLEDAGLQVDATTGLLLRRQRQSLPETAVLRRDLRDFVSESAQAQIELIDLDNRLTVLLASRSFYRTEEQEVTDLRDRRLQRLRAVLADQRAYIGILSNATTTLRNLISQAGRFATFVDQRLLWIRSAPPIELGEFDRERLAVMELFKSDPFAPLREDLVQNPLPWSLAAIVLLFLVIRTRAHRAKLAELGALARRRNCTSFLPTAKALGFTILITAPLPFALWFLHARCAGVPEGITTGIRNVAAFLTFTIFFWIAAHRNGLMVDHFRVSSARVLPLRKNFRWFVPVMAPLVFFATALPIELSASPSAGRLFFIAALLALMAILVRLLHPSAELICWRSKPRTLLARSCFLLSIATPLALIIGAMAGFYASVQELRVQALMSLWMILFVVLVVAILYRWILVSRRRIAVKQALERRAAILAERSGAGSEPGALPQQVASPDEVRTEAVKVVEVEEQTTRLVRAAAIVAIALSLWGIWLPTVPALSALDKFTLWESGTTATTSTTEQSASQPTATFLPGAPASAAAASPQPDRVSLQDLAAALITLLLTFVAAKNIPGLLSLTLLQRLHFTPGSNFAFTTTVRYLLVITGIVISLGWIDVTWGKVQWIAAAITLGIGFGLQEIFANFVAGLIILFERPIRLGDVVTVGDVSGKISQIRIRATTIRQFNNRELIVPNKEFITGKLVNWTLSDSILRVEVPVGIAYGSDTAKAREILLEVARAHPCVLPTPAPDVLFTSFGDSSLAFQLRAHVGSVEDLLPTQSDLHDAVDRRFREAGIEIAFPQTDIHIRSVSQPIPGFGRSGPGAPPEPQSST